MKKYQIAEIGENDNQAGSKAPSDIADVADSLGYERCVVRINLNGHSVFSKIRRQFFYCLDYSKALKQIEPGSVVLLQHPFHHKQINREKILRTLKTDKQVKIISVVHDVEELRGYRFNDYYKNEFSTMVELADVIIVHNEKMLDWFISAGIPENRLISLDIFDYLQDNEYRRPEFERSINVAGNLDVVKCKYIAQLKDIDGVDVHLYGPNFDKSMSESSSVHYHGSFPSSEIPSKLNKGFGLVWDGDSIEDCIGESGQYLRYNNPHKLSLYLSSGLPVVIWKDAAEAGFVSSNDLGICVGSLRELGKFLESVDEGRYGKIADNVASIRRKLIKGDFTHEALSKAEGLIGERNLDV